MQKIQTQVVVNAGIEKVWEFYTNPEKITGWAFASDDWECPHAENDLKVGGRFLTRMQAKGQGFGFDFTGTYTAVVPQKLIAYAMDKETEQSAARECEVVFDGIGQGKTKIVVTFDSEDQNPIDAQKSGWQSILDNFKKLVEAS